MSSIMMADERVAHDDEDPRDHARIIAELRSSAQSPASEEMTAFIQPLAGDPDQAQAARDTYYRTLINTVLDGLEQRRLRALGRLS
jgi:hypothetical protein